MLSTFASRLGFGVVVLIVALVLGALALATDHWEGWRVDRQKLRTEVAQLPAGADAKLLNTSQFYFTRYGGLLRTCFPGNDTAEMLKNKHVVDSNCIYLDYQLSESGQYLSSQSDEYWLAVHVRRCRFALMAMGALLLLLALVAGTYGCWTSKLTATRITVVMLGLACLLIGGAVGTVFALNYLETKRVPEYKMSTLLVKHSKWLLSWSFYLACASCGLTVVTCLVFSLEAISLNRKRKLKKRAEMKMQEYNNDLAQKSRSNDNFFFQPRGGASPAAPGDKMVPVLMYDNMGFESKGGMDMY